MHAFWLNGNLVLEPGTKEEADALALLWQGARKGHFCAKIGLNRAINSKLEVRRVGVSYLETGVHRQDLPPSERREREAVSASPFQAAP